MSAPRNPPGPPPESEAAASAARPRVRGALALVGLLLIASNLRAGITSVGPVVGLIRADQHLSAVAASVIVSTPLVAFALVSPIAPAVAARLGLERALGLALAILACGIVLRSTPPQLLLWVGTALLGVAIALLNVLLSALVKRDYPDRIAPITGLYASVQSAMAALASGLAVPLAGEHPSGWRLALGVWAGLALIALAVFAPRLRARPHPPTVLAHAAAGPAEARADAGAPVPASASAAGSHRARTRARAMWTSPLAWQVTLFMGLQSLAFYVLIAWLSSMEQSAGITAAQAGFHLLLFNLCALVGNLLCSSLTHRTSDQRLIAAGCSLVLIGAYVGLILAPQAGVVWACASGFAGGATIVLALSLFGLRTRDHAAAAALSGMAQAVGYAIAAVGPILIGALHDAAGGSWTPGLLVLIGAGALQLLFGVLASRPRMVQ
ncbi:MFS transporter [Brevibacterium sp. 5221]|uniref:MFS transporter n=1 Tax=Brevibacterium rongguiense TaxID=2695267 RepID=A0A6N9H7M3_9MICO|nr:MFS transporter [Brevibacterium rongguiense]MYM19574.1 MFS transporter [Brevibacterium rongguiense]